MGAIKDNNYLKEEMQFSRIANALSHPARNRIIELIKDELMVTQAMLPDYLNLNTTSVNRHIRFLRIANLIDEYYFIHFSQIKLNENTLKYFRDNLSRFSDNLDN